MKNRNQSFKSKFQGNSNRFAFKDIVCIIENPIRHICNPGKTVNLIVWACISFNDVVPVYVSRETMNWERYWFTLIEKGVPFSQEDERNAVDSSTYYHRNPREILDTSMPNCWMVCAITQFECLWLLELIIPLLKSLHCWIYPSFDSWLARNNYGRYRKHPHGYVQRIFSGLSLPRQWR